MWAIFHRELRAYFVTSLGYIVIGFFLLMAGIFFTVNNLLGASPDFKSVLGSLLFIFLFIVPLLTMRLIAEDTRSKTDQLLLTSPVGVTGIVLGKYLAALALFAAVLAVTGAYPIIMSVYSMEPLAILEILGGYLGFFLLGAAFISVGLFISSTTENPVSAAVATFATLLLLWIVDWVQPSLPKDSLSGLVFVSFLGLAVALIVHLTLRNIPVTAILCALILAATGTTYALQSSLYKGIVNRIVGWFSLVKRFQDFGLGVLSLGPVVYYISFSAIFVFFTVRMIEKRRWS